MTRNIVAPSVLLALGGLIIGAAVGPGVGLTGSIYEGTEGVRGQGASSLRDLLDTAFLESLAEAGQCPYEDQSMGYGGQSGSCAFECPGPKGFFTVEVQTDDDSAGVSGTGTCSPHDAHCSGTAYCNDRVAYSSPTSGTCSGDSDEITDNGIYINCYPEVEDEGTSTSGGDPGPSCILYSPMLVCYDESKLPPLPAKLCRNLSCEYVEGKITYSSPHPGAFLYVEGLEAIGAVCSEGGECDLVVPQLTLQDTGWHLTI